MTVNKNKMSMFLCSTKGNIVQNTYSKKSEHTASRVEDLFNVDICGPFQNIIPTGKRHFLSLIDDKIFIAY